MRIVFRTDDGQAIKTWADAYFIPMIGDFVYLHWGDEDKKCKYIVKRREFNLLTRLWCDCYVELVSIIDY